MSKPFTTVINICNSSRRSFPVNLPKVLPSRYCHWYCPYYPCSCFTTVPAINKNVRKEYVFTNKTKTNNSNLKN